MVANPIIPKAMPNSINFSLPTNYNDILKIKMEHTVRL